MVLIPVTGSFFGQQSMPASQPQYCHRTVLFCTYLQKPEQGYLSQKSDVLSLHGPLLQLHPDLFHSILLPKILACYCQESLVGYTSIWLSVFQTDTLTFIFGTSTATCIVFLAPFILSHFLFFRHVTKSASGTPVPSSQRTIHSLIPGILQFTSQCASEALVRKVTSGRLLKQKEKSPSTTFQYFNFKDKNKTGLYFPPLN